MNPLYVDPIDIGHITRVKVGSVEARMAIDQRTTELEAEFKELDTVVDLMVATVAKNPPQVVPDEDPLILKHRELRLLHYRIEQLRKTERFFKYALAEIDELLARVGEEYKAYIDLMLQDTLTEESVEASRKVMATQHMLYRRINRLMRILYPQEQKPDNGLYVHIEKKPGEFRFNDCEIENMALYCDDYEREEKA
jgi:hypothetical protein